MVIDVLFFAELQEAVGRDKITVEIADITVGQLKENYLDKYATLDEHASEKISQVMVAVNEEYADENTKLKSGDVVAFIPPVSGG